MPLVPSCCTSLGSGNKVLDLIEPLLCVDDMPVELVADTDPDLPQRRRVSSDVVDRSVHGIGHDVHLADARLEASEASPCKQEEGACHHKHRHRLEEVGKAHDGHEPPHLL